VFFIDTEGLGEIDENDLDPFNPLNEVFFIDTAVVRALDITGFTDYFPNTSPFSGYRGIFSLLRAV
jgi:hypothetical protein